MLNRLQHFFAQIQKQKRILKQRKANVFVAYDKVIFNIMNSNVLIAI